MYHKPDGGEYFEKIGVEVPADDSASIGEKMLLYWLIRELKPKVIIETGTHKGLATLYMAHAIHDEGYDGHIHTADPYTTWNQKGNFDKFPELSKYITFYPIMGKDLPVENVDFAFIDGFHEKHEVDPEIDALFPKLSDNACVIFHDCWYGNTDGVNEAVEGKGLKTLWLPTKNALRIYGKYEPKRQS